MSAVSRNPLIDHCPLSNSHLIEQAALNLNRFATLNRGFTAGPSDSFKCRDGWIYAMTIGQPLFVR